MSQFKRFNASENSNSYDNTAIYPQGTLTWDPSNGLRLHDGSTNGGNSVMTWYDITNRPQGTSAIHDLFGGGASVDNGKVLMQTATTESHWVSLLQDVPTSSKGASGDTVGKMAADSSYFYVCTAAYTNGVADIWKRIAWVGTSW